jgi:hypothetical protein
MNLIIIVLIYTKGKVMKIILLNFYFIHISFLFILFQQIREIKSNMYVSFFAKYDLEKKAVPKRRSVMAKGLRSAQQVSSSSQGVHLL